MAGLAFARLAKSLGGLAAPVQASFGVFVEAAVAGTVMGAARRADNKPKGPTNKM